MNAQDRVRNVTPVLRPGGSAIFRNMVPAICLKAASGRSLPGRVLMPRSWAWYRGRGVVGCGGPTRESRPRDGWISTPVSGLEVSLPFTIGGSMMGRYIIGFDVRYFNNASRLRLPARCSTGWIRPSSASATANNQLMTANAQLSMANRRLATRCSPNSRKPTDGS